MNAIIRLSEPPKKSFFHFLLLPPVTQTTAAIGEEPVEIYSFNPIRHKRFPHYVANIKRYCARVYFTGEMKQYPDIYRQPSTGEQFFRHLPQILSRMPVGDVSDVGILCEKEDPRLIPLVEILSRFSPSVSILTEKDVFFERVSRSLLASHGMSLNQKTTATMGKKRVLLVLNTTLSDCSSLGEFLIDLNDTQNLCHPNLLWDITTEETVKFFQAFHMTDIKHCYFVSTDERKLKLIWKISKKS